jgi:hypothetical protein
MTHEELIENLKKDYATNRDVLIIPRWQSKKMSTHQYDSETYVFCEIITSVNCKRNIIRVSATHFKGDQLPNYIHIEGMHIIFRSPDYPNIHTQVHQFKKIYSGYMTNDGKDSEFSYPLFLALLNNVDNFFNGPFEP